MKSVSQFILAIALLPLCCGGATAVELLISGDFEVPQGLGDVPGWTLQEFATGSNATVDTGSITGDGRLWLKPFASGPLGPDQGNFNSQNGVDGQDFLAWQRGDSPNLGNADDFTAWSQNFGNRPLFTNVVLTQTVNALPNETYTFQGESGFEDNFSGFVTNLDAGGPFGAIPSPTVSQFKMEFLNAAGQVIGSPPPLNLRDENTFPGPVFPNTPIVAQSPAGTARVRVTAESRDMAWNGAETDPPGLAQSAYYDNFSLTKASDPPNTELLTNAGLDEPPPSALDFWDLSTVPDASENSEILRTPSATWANNTPGGSRGVWLSAFFGASATFEPEPVSGFMSQTAPAVPGGVYTFAGKTKFEANYSGGFTTIPDSGNPDIFFSGLASPTKTEIELAFLDVNGDVISAEVIDVKASREALIGCSTEGCANNGQWYLHTLQATAPEGTVSARLTGRMIDGVHSGFNPQSAFFDDFSLDGPALSLALTGVQVPEPTSLAGLAVLGGLALGRNRRRLRS
jgi:hypothetical protein